MSKEGFVTFAEKDMRFRARVKRWLSTNRRPHELPPVGRAGGLLLPCATTFIVFTVLFYAAIANIIPARWITFGQAAVISLALGITAAAVMAYYIMNAASALRRAFVSATTLVLAATIGYGWHFSVTLDGVPSDLAVESIPLQGQALVGAIAILALILIAFLAEKWMNQRS